MSSSGPSRQSAEERTPFDDPEKDVPDSEPAAEYLALPDRKGKGRAVVSPEESESDITGDDEDTVNGEHETTYPPVPEDEADSRRIEENLRRWEQAERTRRKNVRESRTANALGHRKSLVDDISRTLWSRRPGDRASYSSHRPLRRGTEDSATDEFDARSESPQTPTPSPGPTSPSPLPLSPDPQTPGQAAPLMVSNPPSALPTPMEGPRPPRAALQAGSYTRLRNPFASTQDLPMTATPPLRILTPDGSPALEYDRARVGHHRWWTEWLCGCVEDKTDEQGGATNPFE